MIEFRELVQKMAGNAASIRALVETATDEQAGWKPDRDNWSLLEVMSHVYNEERIDFRKHLKEVWNNPPKPWEEFQVEELVQVENLRQALEGFLAEREESIAWLRGMETIDWTVTAVAPWGSLNSGDLLVSWVEHDYLHLRQIIELLHAWNEKQASPCKVEYGGGW
jgi:hypothetical protein